MITDYIPSPLIYKTLNDCLKSQHRSIRKYSKHNITFEGDKLPAFSGYAHSIQKHIRGKYLAGLWDCDLHSGLLWMTIQGSECSVELSSNDPMGQVSGGFLKCRGPLIEVSWTYYKETRHRIVLHDINELVKGDSEAGVIEFNNCLLDTMESEYQPHLWCLLVVKCQGLLLEVSPLDNQYRRVGYFEVDNDFLAPEWPISTITIV
jgi:hypothetical protein